MSVIVKCTVEYNIFNEYFQHFQYPSIFVNLDWIFGSLQWIPLAICILEFVLIRSGFELARSQ